MKREFENVSRDIEENNVRLTTYVRAFHLFTIGTVLLLDSEKSIVLILYLYFLRDISANSLNSYAWGTALFAKLHSSLSGELINFKGASWVLEVHSIVFFMLKTNF